MNSHSIATNTLLMPNIPAQFFGYPAVFDILRAKLEIFGDLYAFIKIKGFRRLMIIYNETACAIKARDSLDRTIMTWQERPLMDGTLSIEGLQWNIHGNRSSVPVAPLHSSYLGIRLYYGQHNPINPDPKLFQLQVPKSKKNFMISPPGSPFEDWKQIPESPPNTTVLASDMTHSYSELPGDDVEDLENFRLESPVASDDDEDVNVVGQRRSLVMVVRCRENNTYIPDAQQQQQQQQQQHLLPLITVQDWDGEQQQKARNGRCKPPKVVPTSLPPVRT